MDFEDGRLRSVSKGQASEPAGVARAKQSVPRNEPFLTNFKSDNTVISSFDYNYDNDGNKERVIDANGDRVTWTYDDTYHLTNERRSSVNAYYFTCPNIP